MAHLVWNSLSSPVCSALCHKSDLPSIHWERALKSHKGHSATTNSCLSARFALICWLHLAEWKRFFLVCFFSWKPVEQTGSKVRKVVVDCCWLIRARLLSRSLEEQTKLFSFKLFPFVSWLAVINTDGCWFACFYSSHNGFGGTGEIFTGFVGQQMQHSPDERE